MSSIQFEALLEANGEGGAWPLIYIPVDCIAALGAKGRLCVKGTLNGFPYQSSIFPNGDGTHHLMVNKQMRQGAKAKVGDTLAVLMEADTGPRVVNVPGDLQRALSDNTEASAIFEKLAYSHKKEYVEWIEQAKREETRAGRIQKTVEMLLEGKRVKS
jgi:hypothetical protein